MTSGQYCGRIHRMQGKSGEKVCLISHPIGAGGGGGGGGTYFLIQPTWKIASGLQRQVFYCCGRKLSGDITSLITRQFFDICQYDVKIMDFVYRNLCFLSFQMAYLAKSVIQINERTKFICTRGLNIFYRRVKFYSTNRKRCQIFWFQWN